MRGTWCGTSPTPSLPAGFTVEDPFTEVPRRPRLWWGREPEHRRTGSSAQVPSDVRHRTRAERAELASRRPVPDTEDQGRRVRYKSLKSYLFISLFNPSRYSPNLLRTLPRGSGPRLMTPFPSLPSFPPSLPPSPPPFIRPSVSLSLSLTK